MNFFNSTLKYIDFSKKILSIIISSLELNHIKNLKKVNDLLFFYLRTNLNLLSPRIFCAHFFNKKIKSFVNF